jgi:hypothetical protein
MLFYFQTFSEVIEIVEKVATDSLELSMKKADQKREKYINLASEIQFIESSLK